MPFEQQGTLLVEYATEAVRAYPADHMFRYRLATGLHMDQRPDEALAAIAFAVGSLQVTLNGTLKLHDRMWLLVGLGAGLALFALLTIGGTWFITGRGQRRRTPRR
ncbi:MAG: hypothetical protein HOV83_31425 [Catenulispora sp.]|nr:hypothetical protein [Catenulispora sp.]